MNNTYIWSLKSHFRRFIAAIKCNKLNYVEGKNWEKCVVLRLVWNTIVTESFRSNVSSRFVPQWAYYIPKELCTCYLIEETADHKKFSDNRRDGKKEPRTNDLIDSHKIFPNHLSYSD